MWLTDVLQERWHYRDHNDDDVVTDQGEQWPVVNQPPEATGRPEDCEMPVIEA